jgi:membrane-bound serine protease (ClpP class)
MRERLLTRLTSPDLDVLLLLCGALLIYLEFNVPGTIVPGALGTLMMLLAIFGFNLLPIQHTAVLLLFAAVALMALEAKFASHGVLATAGVLCLVFGLATLVDGPGPEMRVHLSVAASAGVAFGAISFFLAWIALRARRAKRLLGPQAMVGHTAIAMTPLAPTGQVEVRGEIWRATLEPGEAPVDKGVQVTVRAVKDLTLTVSSVQ